ncbi:MAG: DUF4252 domain-containing protein [Gammaproteobacteria bacterium]|nr:hypothetical protein [Gammaproteobacteria bacterium]
MQIKKALLTAAAIGVVSTAVAQSELDFSQIPGAPAQPTVQIDLNPALLNFAAAAAGQTDPGLAELVSGLRNLSVRVYEELEDPAAVSSFVEEAAGKLERAGWQRMVSVQDGDEKVRIFARTAGNEIDGMTVLVLGSSEAVFINIDGRIDPQQLGRLVGAMGMGQFGNIQIPPADRGAEPGTAE